MHKFAQTHVHSVSDAIQPSHPVVPFSSCPHSFPASGSILTSQFFTSGAQSISASASASALPINIQVWFPLELTGLISLKSKGLSSIFSNTTVQKHQFFGLLYCSALPSVHITGKTTALTQQTFVSKVMSLRFNVLSRPVIAFPPRRNRLLISWPQSPSSLILEPRKMKSDTVTTFFPIYLPWNAMTRCHDLHFLNVEL